MRKNLLILLISLLLPIVCSSQNTYPKLTSDSLIVITPYQLKATNLVFLEHKKLKLVVPELNKQILTYKDIVLSYEKSDSLKNLQIDRLQKFAYVSNEVIQSKNEEVENLRSRNKVYKGIAGGGVILSIILLLIVIK